MPRGDGGAPPANQLLEVVELAVRSFFEQRPIPHPLRECDDGVPLRVSDDRLFGLEYCDRTRGHWRDLVEVVTVSFTLVSVAFRFCTAVAPRFCDALHCGAPTARRHAPWCDTLRRSVTLRCRAVAMTG